MEVEWGFNTQRLLDVMWRRPEMKCHPCTFGSHDKKDCGVSVLKAFEIKAPNPSMRISVVESLIKKEYNYKWYHYKGSGITLKRFLKEDYENDFDYILFSQPPSKRKGHAIGIKDNMMIDTAFCHGNTRIHQFMKIWRK